MCRMRTTAGGDTRAAIWRVTSGASGVTIPGRDERRYLIERGYQTGILRSADSALNDTSKCSLVSPVVMAFLCVIQSRCGEESRCLGQFEPHSVPLMSH